MDHKTDMNTIEIDKYKKTEQHFYDGTRKIHNEHLRNFNKIEKYKKLNMTEHKTDIKITKIDKSKKT